MWWAAVKTLISVFHKTWGILRLAEKLFAPQERFFCMELITDFKWT